MKFLLFFLAVILVSCNYVSNYIRYKNLQSCIRPNSYFSLNIDTINTDECLTDSVKIYGQFINIITHDTIKSGFIECKLPNKNFYEGSFIDSNKRFEFYIPVGRYSFHIFNNYHSGYQTDSFDIKKCCEYDFSFYLDTCND